MKIPGYGLEMDDPNTTHGATPQIDAALKFRENSYLPKLDGLRAISIGMVLFEHFISSHYEIGGLGVTIFFVISGYLITSILLTYAERLSIRDAALQFYWRRTLRLFPAYYFCIAATAALNIGGMRNTWLINSLYLMNFKVAADGVWNGSSHFWSLAIEEQFYLLWFIVVVAVPRRFLLPIIVSCLIVAPLYREAMFVVGANRLTNLLLPGVMDSLAMGALLAYANAFCTAGLLWRTFLRWRKPLFFFSAILLLSAHMMLAEHIARVYLRSLNGLMSACLVTIAIDQGTDRQFDWLRNRTLRHIGKISYGIYVYHFFVLQFIDTYYPLDLLRAWIPSYTAAQIMHLIILLATTILIAELSWHFIEKPFMRLKSRIPAGNPGSSVA